jgi:hypothetical protein
MADPDAKLEYRFDRRYQPPTTSERVLASIAILTEERHTEWVTAWDLHQRFGVSCREASRSLESAWQAGRLWMRQSLAIGGGPEYSLKAEPTTKGEPQ